jgi:V/A-type H+-transporting ATPase subunit B
MSTAGFERVGLVRLKGAIACVTGVPGVGCGEQVELVGADGTVRPSRVLSVCGETSIVEVLAPTEGLQLGASRVRFTGRAAEAGVGPELLGRVFDGLGRPRDGLPLPLFQLRRPIDGAPINPCRREYPRDFLETGVSAIDVLTSVVLGQKLPIFTEPGLPHDALAAQIVRQASAPGVERFAVVFAGLGLPRETGADYLEDFRRSGSLSRLCAFLNYADEPAAERLMTARFALTAAEYLAFDLGLHVLVLLNDVTNYGEALREVAAARGEVPSRKGFPGYLYSDLASLFERAGRIQGLPGSITQIPVVTMPSGDVTHPIPDLTGYVTEGRIVLDRDLARRGVYPPVSVLPSLSRLMGDGIGRGRTRDDHPHVARQLYAACARASRARALESIIGEQDLSAIERHYLKFGRQFELRFLAQGPAERRSIRDSLALAWDVLRDLPDTELTRIPEGFVERYGRSSAPEVA